MMSNKGPVCSREKKYFTDPTLLNSSGGGSGVVVSVGFTTITTKIVELFLLC